MSYPDIELTLFDQKGLALLRAVQGKTPLFVCTISNTYTAAVPGITVAGETLELLKYTPPADVELVEYGECKCIPAVPATPDGKPTPALITLTAKQLGHFPFLVVDAGCEVKPQTPYLSVGFSEPGKDIRKADAVDMAHAEQGLAIARSLGDTLSKMADYLVLGESIPGGTTTALAVLMALGIDAKGKVSSSMPRNPHHIKNEVVRAAFERVRFQSRDFTDDPLRATSAFGDPMLITVAGIAMGASKTIPVILAGGTQMTAVLAIMNRLKALPAANVLLATTTYITHDPASDLKSLVEEAGNAPVAAVDLGLDKSTIPGLRAFSEGFVKEGVGAGGTSLAAILASKGKITTTVLRAEIERNYRQIIEPKLYPTMSRHG